MTKYQKLKIHYLIKSNCSNFLYDAVRELEYMHINEALYDIKALSEMFEERRKEMMKEEENKIT